MLGLRIGLKGKLLIAFFFSVLGFQARAQYPAAKPNRDIREEVTGDTNRLAPVTDHFAFALDGDVYFRNNGPDEYYHGFGYWLQARSEAKITNHFRANMRSIFFAGSSSYGYAEPTGYYQLFALSGEYPETVLGGKLWIRAPDLDRQTVGAGLLIQDKEFNGAMLRWSFDENAIVVRADGTGAFRASDDTYNLEALFKSGLVGFGGVLWPFGVEQDHMDHMRDPYAYLFSQRRFDWFSYAFEVGARGSGDAELLILAAEHSANNLKAELKLEARRYTKAFGRDFAGSVQSQYVSYDQYDKSFTNLVNVWVVNDQANVFASHLNLWWRISDQWRVHSLNESGQFNYENAGTVAFYFFRQGIEFCPGNDNRDDCLNFFFTNKVLMNSNAIPPSKTVLQNDRLFKIMPFVGIEGRFRI